MKIVFKNGMSTMAVAGVLAFWALCGAVATEPTPDPCARRRRAMTMPDPLVEQDITDCEKDMTESEAKRKTCESFTSTASSNVSQNITRMKDYFKKSEQQMKALDNHPEKAELNTKLKDAYAEEATLYKKLNKEIPTVHGCIMVAWSWSVVSKS